MPANSPRRFRYSLYLNDGSSHTIDIVLDPATQNCQQPPLVDQPWTRLDCHRCPHCPLTPENTPLCPLAARLAPLVERVGSLLSYDNVAVEVHDGMRTIRANVPASTAASSVMGLISASSGCPHTAFLKPLAWFHQPFASEEETVFRVLSSHLVEHQLNGDGPPDLQQLKDRYRAIEQVNMHIAKRLLESCDNDAAINAIVHLDIFAKAIPFAVDQMLEELRPLYPASGASGVSGASV